MLAAVQHLQDWRIGAQELRHRYAVDAGHLGRVGLQPARRIGPHHHRRDRIARAGGEGVQPAQHIGGGQAQCHLFMQLAQRGLFGAFALVKAPARQRPLAGMAAQGLGPAGEDQCSLGAPGPRRHRAAAAVHAGQARALALVGDHQRHRRRLQAGHRARLHRPGGQRGRHLAAKCVVALHGGGRSDKAARSRAVWQRSGRQGSEAKHRRTLFQIGPHRLQLMGSAHQGALLGGLRHQQRAR